jgi:superfamily I DNA/RNA helicase
MFEQFQDFNYDCLSSDAPVTDGPADGPAAPPPGPQRSGYFPPASASNAPSTTQFVDVVEESRVRLRGSLSDEQKCVFDAVTGLCKRSTPCLLRVPAAPGAGKTATLARCVLYLMIMGVDIEALSLMQTSLKTLAARVLLVAEQLEREAGMKVDTSRLERVVRTAHAFALGRLARRDVDVAIVDAAHVEEKLAETVREDVARGRLPPTAGDGDALTLEVETRVAVRARQLQRGHDSVRCARALDLAAVERVNGEMLKASEFDFDLLIQHFASDPGPDLVKPGTVVVVDEAQDCTRTILLLLKKMLDCGAHVVLVGDPAQGICMFAGADLSPFEEIARGVTCKVEDVALTTNFRSTSEVVALYERVVKSQDRLLRGTSVARRSGVKPELAVYSQSALGDGQPDKDVVSTVEEWILEGVPPSDIAVMRFPKYDHKSDLYKELSKKGIKVVINGGKTVSRTPRRVVALLQLAVKSNVETIDEPVEVLGDAVRAAGGVFPKETSDALERCRERTLSSMHRAYTSSWLESAVSANDKSGRKLKNLQKGREHLEHALCDAKAAVGAVLDALGEGESLAKRQRTEGKTPPVTLAPLAAVARRLAGKMSSDASAQDAAAVSRLADELEKAEVRVEGDIAAVLQRERLRVHVQAEGVRIGTIHSMKGDEATCVIVQGIDRGIVNAWPTRKQMRPFDHLIDERPLAYQDMKDDQKKENAVNASRLIYVAASRAKERLIIQFHLQGSVDDLEKPHKIESDRLVALVRRLSEGQCSMRTIA